MSNTAANRGLAIMVGVTAAACLAYYLATALSASPLFLALIGLAAVGTIVWACLPWWRGADEAVREAHKSAWFWGGLLACIPLIPTLILISGNQVVLERLASVGQPYKLLAGGVLLTLTFQLSGYLIAWAAWWMKRR